MSKAGLVFIFNHKFERNIPRLEDYYSPRFSWRHYLMPFASEGAGERVTNVVENSFTFGGHISQGHAAYNDPDVTHYVFLGDDLILNPALDEHNLVDKLQLAPNTGYIKSLAANDDFRYRWAGSTQAMRSQAFTIRLTVISLRLMRGWFEEFAIHSAKQRSVETT